MNPFKHSYRIEYYSVLGPVYWEQCSRGGDEESTDTTGGLLWMTLFCLCDLVSSEDRFGKAGRDRVQEATVAPSEAPSAGGTGMDWSELEPLYRLDKHAYDLKLNFNVSLEDWDNFDWTVDRMFTMLGNFNHQPNGRRSNLIPGEGRGGRDHALVSSTDQSASAIYLTTLATPALLLREAAAEVLREALGLNGGEHRSSSSSSSSSCPPVPAEEGRSDWDHSPPLLNQLGEEGPPRLHDEDEEARDRGDEEEEEELFRRRSARWRLNHAHCQCSDFVQEAENGLPV